MIITALLALSLAAPSDICTAVANNTEFFCTKALDRAESDLGVGVCSRGAELANVGCRVGTMDQYDGKTGKGPCADGGLYITIALAIACEDEAKDDRAECSDIAAAAGAMYAGACLQKLADQQALDNSL